MADENAYLDTLKRLADAPPSVRNDVVLEATRLADALAGSPGSVARGEEALQSFDDELDRLLAAILAVIASGSTADVDVAALALETLVSAAAGPHRPHVPLALGVVARASLTMTAGALAWRRLDVVEQLAHVSYSDGYAPAVSVLANPDLRHLELFDRGADTAFQAHVAWFMDRTWRASVGVLSSEEQLRLAFGETDVLCGMLAVDGGRERDLYSAGLALGDGRVEDRIVARSREPGQRTVLCRLFGASGDRLEERLSDAYAGLTPGRRLTSFRQQLFRAG